MKLFDIKIDGKTYEFVNSINYNGKNYVAYEDAEQTYISEFIINDNNISFQPIEDDTVFEEVRKAMAL